MRILGFDTATRATAVAYLDTDSGRAVQRRDDPPTGTRPRHTSRLMGLVVEALAEAGAAWSDVDRIAVGVGPGTFTGLRIGVATALGLAQARGIPLVGVSTLHSLAAAAVDLARPTSLVVPVIDARRAEVFSAAWLATEAPRASAAPVVAPQAVAPTALGVIVRGSPAGRAAAGWLAVGDGAVAFREALEASGARVPPDDSERHRVSAIAHCRLAAELEPEPPEGIRPDYLRLPDAEISLRAARQR